MELQDRIKRFLSTYQTTGWLLVLMVAALLVQGILIMVFPEQYDQIILYLTLPGSLLDLVKQPWSLVTWPFFHSQFWFLWTIFAGMMLFTFGQIHQQFLNELRTRRIVMLAVPLIGLLTVTYTTVLNTATAPNPDLLTIEQPISGATEENETAEKAEEAATDATEEGSTEKSDAQSVSYTESNPAQRWGGRNPAFPSGMFPILMLLMIGAITLVPHFPIQMFLFGQVEIRWVGGIFFLIVWASSGFYSPWGFAILLGGLMGFLNVYLLRKGTDLTDIIWSFYKEDKKPRMKVKYSNPQTQHATAGSTQKKRTKNSTSSVEGNDIPQEQIDVILDKISASGYDSLSREEKELLFKASNQDKND